LEENELSQISPTPKFEESLLLEKYQRKREKPNSKVTKKDIWLMQQEEPSQLHFNNKVQNVCIA
jgi:hypothetical protein